MDTIIQLWLPILVASVAVFFASFVAWMVLPHHKKDVKVLPDEAALTSHLQTLKIPPGTYMYPNCESPAEMSSEDYKKRYEDGPWGSINIVGAKPNFGRNLMLTFLFYVGVSVVVGYITAQARAFGADFAPVFQVAGAAAVLGYCAGQLPNSIFFGKPARFVLTDFVDCLVYALLTGAVFAWLWPAAEVIEVIEGIG